MRTLISNYLCIRSWPHLLPHISFQGTTCDTNCNRCAVLIMMHVSCFFEFQQIFMSYKKTWCPLSFVSCHISCSAKPVRAHPLESGSALGFFPMGSFSLLLLLHTCSVGILYVDFSLVCEKCFEMPEDVISQLS